MKVQGTRSGWRFVAIGVVVGLVALGGAAPSTAKAKKKKKTTKKKAAVTTVKKTTATTAPAGGQAATPKGTIKIGTIGQSVNGTTGARTLDETKKTAEAWATTVNRDGGINGYKVEVVYRATNGDSARALAAIKEFDKLGVVALAGTGDSAAVTAIFDYVKDKKIPIVGGSALDAAWSTHPMLFSVGVSQYQASYASVYGAKIAGAKNYLSLYCTESSACVQSVPFRTRAADDLGGIKATSEGASAVAVDYTSNCINAKNKGIDYIHIAGVNLTNAVRDCQRQGYHPIWGQTVTANFQSTIDALKGEQFVGPLQEMPAWYTGPEAAPFHEIMKLTDLKFGDYGQIAVQAWLGLEVARKAIEKLTVPNPTRANFLQALCQIKGETLGGAHNGPLDYTGQCTPGGPHSMVDCWFNDLIIDGKFVLMNDKGNVAKTLKEGMHCGSDARAQPTAT